MSYNEKAMVRAGGGELDEFMKRWTSYVQWTYVRIPVVCFKCYRHYESYLVGREFVRFFYKLQPPVRYGNDTLIMPHIFLLHRFITKPPEHSKQNTITSYLTITY